METIYCIFNLIAPYFFKVVAFSDDVIRPLLFLVAAVVAIRVAYLKLGRPKILFDYALSGDRFTHFQISSVTLVNKKDYAIGIWSIDAELDKSVRIKLTENNPPTIIKAFETVSIDISKYSTAMTKSGKIDYLSNKKIKIIVNIGEKEVTCRKIKHAKNNASYISTHKATYAGRLLSNDVKYILRYYRDGKDYVAFIDKFGFIGNEWIFRPNVIEPNESEDIDIQSFLIQTNLHDLIDNYKCFKVENLNDTPWEIFRKSDYIRAEDGG